MQFNFFSHESAARHATLRFAAFWLQLTSPSSHPHWIMVACRQIKPPPSRATVLQSVSATTAAASAQDSPTQCSALLPNPRDHPSLLDSIAPTSHRTPRPIRRPRVLPRVSSCPPPIHNTSGMFFFFFLMVRFPTVSRHLFR